MLKFIYHPESGQFVAPSLCHQDFNFSLQMRGPSPNMACAGDEAALEDLIRTKAQSKGIRPQEFFLDYDKLRSGYVTGEFDLSPASDSTETVLEDDC